MFEEISRSIDLSENSAIKEMQVVLASLGFVLIDSSEIPNLGINYKNFAPQGRCDVYYLLTNFAQLYSLPSENFLIDNPVMKITAGLDMYAHGYKLGAHIFVNIRNGNYDGSLVQIPRRKKRVFGNITNPYISSLKFFSENAEQEVFYKRLSNPESIFTLIDENGVVITNATVLRMSDDELTHYLYFHRFCIKGNNYLLLVNAESEEKISDLDKAFMKNFFN